MKTPRFSGDADFEAFLAQFELLADSVGWSVNQRALQLAMCLSGEAVACLLLLSPEQRRDYRALVGALNRRYGLDRHPELILSALGRRERLPGESLRSLANEIKSLTRRAYGHMS